MATGLTQTTRHNSPQGISSNTLMWDNYIIGYSVSSYSAVGASDGGPKWGVEIYSDLNCPGGQTWNPAFQIGKVTLIGSTTLGLVPVDYISANGVSQSRGFPTPQWVDFVAAGASIGSTFSCTVIGMLQSNES